MNEILFGDCRLLMKQFIADGIKVQTCVTSPPYFGLRDYGTGSWEGGDPDCKHTVGGQVQDTKAPGAITTGQRPGVDSSKCRTCGALRIDQQIGLEQSPDAYVKAMVEVFGLVKELLADDGTLWLNLGDSYAGSGKGAWDNKNGGQKETYIPDADCPQAKLPKTFTGIKAKDMCGIPWRVAFGLQADGWYLRSDIIWHKPNAMPESVTDRPTKSHEYLFLMAKSESYYYDTDAIRETHTSEQSIGTWEARKAAGHPTRYGTDNLEYQSGVLGHHPLGRNKRTVWSVNTAPYSGAHFATFPIDLILPCILAGSRPGDIVFDPFMGSGTTALVAKQNGRNYLGCELNPAYKELQDERLSQETLFAPDQPVIPTARQEGLFE